MCRVYEAPDSSKRAAALSFLRRETFSMPLLILSLFLFHLLFPISGSGEKNQFSGLYFIPLVPWRRRWGKKKAVLRGFEEMGREMAKSWVEWKIFLGTQMCGNADL